MAELAQYSMAGTGSVDQARSFHAMWPMVRNRGLILTEGCLSKQWGMMACLQF